MKANPIKITNLNFSYEDRQILKDVNFLFNEKMFYSILGPNGSGKTTFLKNLLRILEPSKNCVFIDNLDLSKYTNKELSKKLSYVPQNTSLDFEFSVFDIVLMGRSPYINRFSAESSEDIKKVEDAMRVTNTWSLKDKNINNLSGGEQQRVMVARAIAQDTDVILLDEPISHLDIYHQVELLETIKSLKENKTIIAILHDINLAAQYSDYLILFNEGHIVNHGIPCDVITKENIYNVYKLEVQLIKDPITNKPHIILGR